MLEKWKRKAKTYKNMLLLDLRDIKLFYRIAVKVPKCLLSTANTNLAAGSYRSLTRWFWSASTLRVV